MDIIFTLEYTNLLHWTLGCWSLGTWLQTFLHRTLGCWSWKTCLKTGSASPGPCLLQLWYFSQWLSKTKFNDT